MEATLSAGEAEGQINYARMTSLPNQPMAVIHFAGRGQVVRGLVNRRTRGPRTRPDFVDWIEVFQEIPSFRVFVHTGRGVCAAQGTRRCVSF